MVYQLRRSDPIALTLALTLTVALTLTLTWMQELHSSDFSEVGIGCFSSKDRRGCRYSVMDARQLKIPANSVDCVIDKGCTQTLIV